MADQICRKCGDIFPERQDTPAYAGLYPVCRELAKKKPVEEEGWT